MNTAYAQFMAEILDGKLRISDLLLHPPDRILNEFFIHGCDADRARLDFQMLAEIFLEYLALVDEVADPCLQYFKTERLRYKVIGTGFEPFNLLLCRHTGSQQDQGDVTQVGALLDRTTKL